MSAMGVLLSFRWFEIGLGFAGSAYLYYLAVKVLRANFAKLKDEGEHAGIANKVAYLGGFSTAMLNPKAYVYFGAVMAPFVTGDVSWVEFVVYAVAVLIASGTVSISTAIMVSAERSRAFFLAYSERIPIAFGIGFITFASWMLWRTINTFYL
jgi:threonine/homoserine/homoserine lactone efflux protein